MTSISGKASSITAEESRLLPFSFGKEKSSSMLVTIPKVPSGFHATSLGSRAHLLQDGHNLALFDVFLRLNFLFFYGCVEKFS